MADFLATTTSEGGEIKSEIAVKKITDKWSLPDISCVVSNKIIRIYKYNSFEIYDNE